MNKTMILAWGDLEAFRRQESSRYDRPVSIYKLLEMVSEPKSYPALLVWSIENCADEGLFLVDEYVYPEELQ